MAAQEAQKKEAEKHVLEAKKALGTSWWNFKCRSDILTASIEYTAAATCFRNAKMLPEAVQAWQKAADLQEQQFDLWSAARAYDAAAALCDGDGPGGPPAAAENWQEAFRCYRLAGKTEVASKTLVKLAALHEKQGNPKLAQKDWTQALELLQDDADVPKAEVINLCKDNIGFLVRSDLIEEALVATDTHIEVLRDQGHFSFVHKEILAKVVLILHLNQDIVRAQDILDSNVGVEGWLTCREHSVGSDLVEAFRANDAEAGHNLVKDQMFSFLQVEVARLARRLQVPAVEMQAPASSTSADVEPNSEAQTTADAQNLGALLM